MRVPRSAPDLDALLAHADWVHRLATQLCRDQHAAADAAQRTLLAALRAPIRQVATLRAFLARTLRNMLQQQGRDATRRVRREQVVAADGLSEATADVAERAELHQFLGRCVLELPEPQRALVLLHYFEGKDVADVAARTGITEDAVRSHLRRARDTLRVRLNGDPRSARAFAALLAAVPVVPIAAAFAMSMPIKSFAAAAAAAVLALLWWSPRLTDDAAVPSSPTNGATLARTELASPSASDADEATRARTAAAAEGPAVAATGSLHLRALWADGTAAGGVRVIVSPDRNRSDHDGDREVRTDSDGTATVTELPCSDGQLRVDWRRGEQFTITAGATTEVVVQMQPGVTVRGIVVDEHGNPVPTARVWLSHWGGADEGLEIGAVEPDGTFVVRDVPRLGDCNFVASFAPGKLASTLVLVQGEPGTVQDVCIDLREPGVSLQGRVFLPGGEPARGACVWVGAREPKPWSREAVWRVSRPPIETKCDEHGRFLVDGLVPSSTQPMWVRAPRSAIWHERIELPAAGVRDLHIRLAIGATFRGRVTDATGEPATSVAVIAQPDVPWVRRRDERWPGPQWAQRYATSGPTGDYELSHVAPGPLRLVALRWQPPARTTHMTLAVDAGEAVWNPQLGVGTTIRGIVVDENGQPLNHWDVRAHGETQGTSRGQTTDAEGRFQIDDCGDEFWHITVFAPHASMQIAAARAVGVRSGTADLRLVVPTRLMPTATIIGRVVGDPLRARRVPPPPVTVQCWRDGAFWLANQAADDDGTFRLGLVPAGTYTLWLQHDGRCSDRTEPFVVRAGETRDVGVLRFGDTGDLVATVEDASGAPLDGVTCHVIRTIADFDMPVAVARAAAGRLRVANELVAADYRLRVVDAAHPSSEVAFTITPHTETTTTLRIAPSIACVLRFVSKRPGGIVSHSLRWRRDGGAAMQEHVAVNAFEGRTLPRHLLPGSYELTATDEVGEVAMTRFTISPTDAAGREVTIHVP